MRTRASGVQDRVTFSFYLISTTWLGVTEFLIRKLKYVGDVFVLSNVSIS